MLVLSRKKNESFLICPNVRVRYLGQGQGRVKLGIEAPSNMGVVRMELVRDQLVDAKLIDPFREYPDDEIFEVVQKNSFNWVKG